MAVGDYSKISGIKGYDELRKFIHKGSGSPKLFQQLRDKKKKKLDSKQDSVEPIDSSDQTPPKGDKVSDYELIKASQERKKKDKKDKPKKETFQESRERRKEEGKWYLGKYAEEAGDYIKEKGGEATEKLKELLTVEEKDPIKHESTLKPLGTIVKEKKEAEKRRKQETFEKN